MTTTTATEAPAFDLKHSHTLDMIVAHDVVVSTWDRGLTRLEVVEVVEGATNYARALEIAKSHRTAAGRYGYTAPRYSCGCRSVGYSAGGHSDVEFVDLATA